MKFFNFAKTDIKARVHVHSIHLHLFYMTQIHDRLIIKPFIEYLSYLTQDCHILIVRVVLLNNIPEGKSLKNSIELEVASKEESQDLTNDTANTSQNSEVLHHTEDYSLVSYRISLETEIHLRNQSGFFWHYDLIWTKLSYIIPILVPYSRTWKPMISLLKFILSKSVPLICVKTRLKLYRG